MDLIVGVRAHLLGLTAIRSIVSAPTGSEADRIKTPVLPQKITYPAVQLQLVSDVDGEHLRGPNNVPRDRVQVDSWAKTRDEAYRLGRLCRQRLSGFSGVWVGSGSPAPYLRVQQVRYEVGSEQFEADILGGLCRHTADYFVTYTDSEDEILINAS